MARRRHGHVHSAVNGRVADELEALGVLKNLRELSHLANQQHHNNDHEKQTNPASTNIVKVGQQRGK
jgi:hypothetical protein